MKEKKKTEDDQMNRRTLVALLSVASIATWNKPIINSIVTPAHAQMSCPIVSDIDIIGRWSFTDQNNVSVEIEFVDENNLIFDNRTSTDPWQFATDDSTLILDIRNPRAAWQGQITQEDNCVGSEITITIAPTIGDIYTAPLVGERI